MRVLPFVLLRIHALQFVLLRIHPLPFVLLRIHALPFAQSRIQKLPFVLLRIYELLFVLLRIYELPLVLSRIHELPFVLSRIHAARCLCCSRTRANPSSVSACRNELDPALSTQSAMDIACLDDMEKRKSLPHRGPSISHREQI
jgi:hypothetical protein